MLHGVHKHLILREDNVHNVAQEAVVLAQRRVVRLADQAQQTRLSRIARSAGY